MADINANPLGAGGGPLDDDINLELPSDDEIADLNPFVVLGNKNSSANPITSSPIVENTNSNSTNVVSNASARPGAINDTISPNQNNGSLSQEELIRQAAQPGQALRVPPKESDGTMQATIGDPLGENIANNRIQEGSFGGIETRSRADQMPEPGQIIGMSPLQDGNAIPVPPQVDDLDNVQNVKSSPEIAPQPDLGSERKGAKMGAATLFGLLIILLAGLAGGVVMVNGSGTRVPLLYNLITKLPTGLSALNQQSISAVQSQKTYVGQLDIKLDSGSENSSFSLTSETAQFTSADFGYLIPATLTTSGVNDTSIYLANSDDNLTAGSDINYLIDATRQAQSSSGESTTVVNRLDGSEVNYSILTPILRPIPVTQILKSGAKEQSYEKSVGKSVAVYKSTLNIKDIEAWFPKDATLTNFSSVVHYAWKTALPTSVQVSGQINYKGQSYEYNYDLIVSNFDKKLDAGLDENLTLMVNTKQGELSTMNVFANQIGLNMSDILNDISGLSSSSVPVLPSGGTTTSGVNSQTTETPSASATTSVEPTTVSPSASASPTIIVPSGEGTTAALAAITTVPPKPSTTVSNEAKARDIQRKRDLADMASALTEYYRRYGSYPVVTGSVQAGSSSSLIQALVPSIMTKMPLDPLKSTYWYTYTSNGTTFSLRSVAENYADTAASQGGTFAFFEKRSE